MILDGHIHMRPGPGDRQEFVGRLGMAGVDGGLLISCPPATFTDGRGAAPPAERLDDLLLWSAAADRLYPFFWIDPIEVDALDQVDMATRRGVSGFKVICDRYYPGDQRAMEVFRAIAHAGCPLLFHS